MLIEFSQELRMYSMVALIALVQAWILLRLLEEDSPGRWIAFVAVAVIGVYTHLHYWLFLAGTALTFVRERRRLPLWRGIAALGTVAVVYAFNYRNLLEFIAVRGGEYAMHFPSALPKLLAAFTVGFNYFALPEQQLGRPVGMSDIEMNWPLVILAAIPAAIILWRIVWLHFADAPQLEGSRVRSLMLAHELFTVPVLIAFIASLVTHKYWLQPKYLIFSAPFALLFIALAYRSIGNGLLRRFTALSAVFVLAIALLHFWNPQDYGRRENWREAANVLTESLDDQSALVVLPGSFSLLKYYAPSLDNRWIILRPPSSPEKAGAFEDSVRADLAGKREVYYLRYDVAQNLRDPRDLVLLALDNWGTRAGTLKFNPRFRLLRWTSRDE
jgi:hypothetical protein